VIATVRFITSLQSHLVITFFVSSIQHMVADTFFHVLKSSPLEFQTYFSSSLFTNHKVTPLVAEYRALMFQAIMTLLLNSPLRDLYKCYKPTKSLTLKMTTEMFAEKLENILELSCLHPIVYIRSGSRVSV
jgi:hypothetical protein